jgi:hypothetical protein
MTNTSSSTFRLVLGEDRSRPKRVVKQIIKRVKGDGTETVEVKYLLDDNELRRVEEEAENKMKEINEDSKQGSRKRSDDELLLTKSLPANLKIKIPVSLFSIYF